VADPASALISFILLVSLLAVLFWPGDGLVARLVRIAGMTERVQLEDALKHLSKCEWAGTPCTVESLAGSLETSRGQAVKLLGRLEELGFALADGEAFVLTEAGSGYALRVIRTHRLVERYLADRTGVRPVDWHSEAEKREHTLTPAETESLASSLGHPLYDPHGDPIPTAAGELPPPIGVALTALQPGQVASIVHLEDEPQEVFEELAMEGLTPSMPVKILDAGPGSIRFEAGGREHALAPVVARNITVQVLPDAVVNGEAGETLADLEVGGRARVIGILPTCQGPPRRRLLDLGLVPGTSVEAEMSSAAGDPIAYRIRGALIALRREQAELIQVDRHGPEPELES
jgi:DtxR family Mn-dependent transcriptional regulator